MGTGSHCNVPRAFHTQFRGPSDSDATSQGLPQRPGDDCPNDTSMCQAYPTSLSSQGDEAKTGSSHFPRQEIGLERGRDFYSRVPSQDFLEILASEATGNHSPKWEEGLEVKGAAADPTDLPTLGWGLSLSLSLNFSLIVLQLASFPACSPMCVFWWRIRLELREKCFPHRVHQ